MNYEDNFFYWTDPYNQTGHPIHQFLRCDHAIDEWKVTHPDAKYTDKEAFDEFQVVMWAVVVPADVLMQVLNGRER